MAKKVDQRIIWWVEHPDHGVAVVQAPDWELATVEAAKWWDVPWRTVAACCTFQRKETLPKFVCADCSGVFYGRDGNLVRCPKCEAAARDRELNRRARDKRYWRKVNRDEGPREPEGSYKVNAAEGGREGGLGREMNKK